MELKLESKPRFEEFLAYVNNEVARASYVGRLKVLTKALGLASVDADGKVGWKRIRMTVPPARKAGSDREPTRDELFALLDVCNVKLKFAVTAMCSSGFRVGAWDYLRLGMSRRLDVMVSGLV